MREIAREERKKQRAHLASLKGAIRETHRGRSNDFFRSQANQ
jgi:hypothetical protein